jgi:hypothetical protein
MTATFRRSKAKKAAEKAHPKKRATPPPSDFFTPTGPEPAPLYRFVEDWRRGVMPSNANILAFLSTWKSSPVLASDPALSPAGQSLVEDLRELGVLLTRVINERNGDELLQRFVGHLRLAGRVLRTPHTGSLTVVEDIPQRRRIKLFGRRDQQIQSETTGKTKKVRQDAKELMELGQLLITSGDFRSVVAEIQKLVWRALNLREPQVDGGGVERGTRQIETWETETTGSVPTGELHQRLNRTAEEIAALKDQRTFGQPASSFTAGLNRTTEGTAAPRDQRTFGQSASGFTAEVYPPQEQQRHTQVLSEHLGAHERLEEKEKPTVKSSKPSDEIDRLLDDARPLFKRLSGNDEFLSSMAGIYAILTRWQGAITMIPGTVLPADLAYDANFAAAQQDLLLLAERFANGRSLGPIIDSIAQMRQEAVEDYELRDFLLDWRAFLKACTSDPAYVEHDEYLRRGRFLLERTSQYAERKYRALFQKNVDSWNSFLEGWQQDKLTSEIGRLITRIVRQDIFGGTNGRGLLNLAAIQGSLINDLRNVILPALLRSMHELPLPHMEIEQGPNHVALDNIVLPAAFFAPANLDLRTATAVHLTPRARLFGNRRGRKTAPATESGTHVSLAGMKGDIPNIRFALDRTAFPRVRDTGTIDMRLTGKGMNIAVDVATDINAAARRFHVTPVLVRVNIDRLAMRFYDVKHGTFFAAAKPYLQYTMKSRIERAVCDRIVDTIYFVDSMAGRLAKGTIVQ